MKKSYLLILATLLTASLATASNLTYNAGADELGAHNGYGRGCVMCHAPHGGSEGNGVTTTDTLNGNVALWGQNLGNLYGVTFTFTPPTTRATYSATLPATGASVSISDTNSIILLCLSCHDGTLATGGMMQNKTVEALPIVGGHAPTLFSTTPGNSGQNYYNEHPAGPNANVSCNGSVSGGAASTSSASGYNWDCIGGGNSMQPVQMSGTASSQFLTNNPSSFWNAVTWTACGGTTGVTCAKSGSTTNTWGYNTSGNPLSTPSGGTTVNAVTCTTCHNQHDMTVWSVNGTNYATMFFIKGQYTPSSGGNSVAQFCRNCHGGNSNEMAGITTVTTN